MNRQIRTLIGSWIDAIGTDLVAYGEIRELTGMNDINNKIIAVGEALESIGSFLIAQGSDDVFSFKVNNLNGIGSAIAMIENYQQYLEPEETVESISYEIYGDMIQMIASGISGKTELKNDKPIQALGNLMQSLGAGLEAYGGYLTLEENERGLWYETQGAIIQSLGSNIYALVTSRDYLVEQRLPKLNK